MERTLDRRRMSALLALAALLVLSMGVTSLSAPRAGITSAGDSLGQTGFAYLGGLRKFAAAVLWNRIEPLHHEYYDDVSLSDQRYMVPVMYMVTALDPQFEQAYYVSSWIVRERVGDSQGIALARQGLKNNPDSGLMHQNLLQLLILSDRQLHAAEIIRITDRVAGNQLQWVDDEDRFEGLAVARDALILQGQVERAQALSEELVLLRARGVGQGDHDHDGDGKQDH